MNNINKEICEACGTEMKDWDLTSCCTLSLCPDCGHIKRDMARCNAGAREHAWGGSGFFDDIRTNLTYNRLNGLIKGKQSLKILEIGFGAGKLLTKFLKTGHQVYGVDAEMLEINVNEDLQKNGNLIYNTFEDAELPESEFDVIYGIHVIEHVVDPAHVFAKCSRLLKENGFAYFLTPNSQSKGLRIFKENWWNLEDPTHIRFFSAGSAGIMLETAGFKNVRTAIPVWDSMTLEINSFLRGFSGDSKEHGVMGKSFTKVIDALGLPVSLLTRMANKQISPTLEIIASGK
ncbi:class I SAM-dependent methyltransferase [candidate division KSB1 bacterium]